MSAPLLILAILALAGGQLPGIPPSDAQRAQAAADAEILRTTRAAAEAGSAKDQGELGRMYEFGLHGVKQDYSEAAKWLHLAVAQGDAWAQVNLAMLYYTGHGVAQDPAEGAKLYHLAAAQGNQSAQVSLGNFYWMGKGVAQDHVLAYMWYAVAASMTGAELKLATDGRDFSAAKMTPAEIAEAEALAKKCLESKLKNCGR